MSKIPKVKVTTPVGVTRFPWLNRPDTKYKAEGEYKVDLVVDEDGMEDIVEKATEVLDAAYERQVEQFKTQKKGAKIKSLKKADVFIEDADPETGEPTGKLIIRANLKAYVTPKKGDPFKQSPALLDAKGKPLPPQVAIFAGTTGRLGIELIPYYAPDKNTVGVTKRLKVFQVKELAARNDNFGMGEIEGGYVADEDDGYSMGSMDDDPPFDSDNDGTDNFY